MLWNPSFNNCPSVSGVNLFNLYQFLISVYSSSVIGNPFLSYFHSTSINRCRKCSPML